MDTTNRRTARVEFSGLFDLQVNGFGGVDFNHPLGTEEEILRAIGALRTTGVTRFLPTLITSPLERFGRCARNLVRVNHPAIAGIHLEGPYISGRDGPRGAHPLEHVAAAGLEDFLRRQEAAEGSIRLVTLAPEAPGAMRLIEQLAARGVRVAIGHSAASSGQILEAVKAGATLSTHLGNGCEGVLPRHPNLLWDQLAEDGLLASFVVDGHHLPPATVKAMMRAKTAGRSILVTDAISAAGCEPGEYELNGERVRLGADGRVSPPGKPWLAGSALTLDRAVGNTVRFTGLPLAEVLAMASGRPAEYLWLKPSGRVVAEWDALGCRLSSLEVFDG